MSVATGMLLLAAKGWRRGESWVWWTLAAVTAAGFPPALIVHASIGYVDFWHLAPVVFAAAVSATGLALARPHLCAAAAGATAPGATAPSGRPTVVRWPTTPDSG
jgi:hypothetical protein